MPRLATVLALAALATATPMQPNPVSQHEMSSSVSTPSPTSSPPSATPPSPGLKWAGEVQPGLFMTFNGDVKSIVDQILTINPRYMEDGPPGAMQSAQPAQAGMHAPRAPGPPHVPQHAPNDNGKLHERQTLGELLGLEDAPKEEEGPAWTKGPNPQEIDLEPGNPTGTPGYPNEDRRRDIRDDSNDSHETSAGLEKRKLHQGDCGLFPVGIDYYIHGQMKWLHKLGGMCTTGLGACTRLTCDEGSATYFCDDREPGAAKGYELSRMCERLGRMLSWIWMTCKHNRADGFPMSGNITDNEGFSVWAGIGNCSAPLDFDIRKVRGRKGPNAWTKHIKECVDCIEDAKEYTGSNLLVPP